MKRVIVKGAGLFQGCLKHLKCSYTQAPTYIGLGHLRFLEQFNDELRVTELHAFDPIGLAYHLFGRLTSGSRNTPLWWMQ
jgi:hypothetical protein